MKELNRKISIKVGILAPEASQKHSGSGLTMAELGAIHEFGSADGKIPARSFLRVPILGAKGMRVLRNALKDRLFCNLEDDKLLCSLYPEFLTKACKSVAEWAYLQVLQAFASNGGGTWEPLKNNRESKQILVDTKELKQSVFYKVEEY